MTQADPAADPACQPTEKTPMTLTPETFLNQIPVAPATTNQIFLVDEQGVLDISIDPDGTIASSERPHEDAFAHSLHATYTSLTKLYPKTLKTIVLANPTGDRNVFRLNFEIPLVRLNLPTPITGNEQITNLDYIYEHSGPAGKPPTAIAVFVSPVSYCSMITNHPIQAMDIRHRPELSVDFDTPYKPIYQDHIAPLGLKPVIEGCLKERLALSLKYTNHWELRKHRIILLARDDIPTPDISWYMDWMNSIVATKKSSFMHDLQSLFPSSAKPHHAAAILINTIARNPSQCLFDLTHHRTAYANSLAMPPRLKRAHVKDAIEHQQHQTSGIYGDVIYIRQAFRDELLAKYPECPETIHMYFSGAGDSGDEMYAESLPNAKDLDKIVIDEHPILLFEDQMDERQGFFDPGDYKPKLLETVLGNIGYSALRYAPGWEVNEGSQGKISIHLRTPQPYAEITDITYNELDDEDEEEDI